jgi:hypothetical protein
MENQKEKKSAKERGSRKKINRDNEKEREIGRVGRKRAKKRRRWNKRERLNPLPNPSIHQR